MKALFEAHLKGVLASTLQVCETLGIDGLVVDAGDPTVYWEDDAEIPYRPYHHFTYFCPATGPSHKIVITHGNKPKLLYYQPEDFWYEHEPIGNPFWADGFDIEVCPKSEDLWKRLPSKNGLAYVGPNEAKAAEIGLKTTVATLKERLNWNRAIKSDYEVHLLEIATERASQGHVAAKECFLNGGSEFQIYRAYLEATEALEHELPYDSIIGIDEKSAILHYRGKRKHVNGKVMLIDAGFKYQGYGSDITRTYCLDSAPSAFRGLIDRVNQIQLRICDAVRPGVTFRDLHDMTHREVAALLNDLGITNNVGTDESISEGYTRAFFPHGLGHMLGIFVHDVGGRQVNPQGELGEVDPEYKYLRNQRAIEEGQLFTIEPGVYFIEMLLRPFREKNAPFNWDLISELGRYGGVRIEDNLYVTSNGVKNITRDYLP